MSTITLERPVTRDFDRDSQAARTASQDFEVRPLDTTTIEGDTPF